MDLLPIIWNEKVKKLDVIIIRYDTNRDGVGINILIIIIDMCIILSSLMPSLFYKTLQRMNETHLGTQIEYTRDVIHHMLLECFCEIVF